MSAGGAFGGNRGLSPVPPEKGVFPLDHMHLCDLEKKEYLSCLKTSGHQSEKCRLFSKKYLECRMEKFSYPISWMKLFGVSKYDEDLEPKTEENNLMELDGKTRHVGTWIR
ncbi:cytochrome c oxidase assembly protein COX19 isoform X1 [Pyrus x bretschneideri]|uniref:cytochrome c oxidase assembly protein COX19 isoform X1 n=1 Tax=Pyrus x bretschneideri TaxID=225117 RepID=UPI00202F5E85|nr:cytochrome c oxidase assembly protein COX19 isoform X1 [Pyrus x bretschneideri]